MLQLRGEHMTAFGRTNWAAFEDRMVAHLGRFLPQQSEELGEPRLRDTIRQGAVRAPAYGFHTERLVCQFIDLMVSFGRDFDRDGRCPWASRILSDRALTDADQKMDRLYETAMAHEPK